MIKLPSHKASCSIIHNDHLDVYQTVEEYISFNESDWSSKEDYELACKNNELWCIQWYPDTPIGSYVLYASSYTKLMDEVDKYVKLEEFK